MEIHVITYLFKGEISKVLELCKAVGFFHRELGSCVNECSCNGQCNQTSCISTRLVHQFRCVIVMHPLVEMEKCYKVLSVFTLKFHLVLGNLKAYTEA